MLLYNHARLMAQDNHSKEYLVSIMFSHYDQNNNGNLEREELEQVNIKYFIFFITFIIFDKQCIQLFIIYLNNTPKERLFVKIFIFCSKKILLKDF